MLTWFWAAGFQRKARGHTQKWLLNIRLSRLSGLEVAVEVPAGRAEFVLCIKLKRNKIIECVYNYTVIYYSFNVNLLKS